MTTTIKRKPIPIATSWQLFDGQQYADSLLLVAYCDNVTFYRCRFANCVIRLESCSRIRIIDCEFDQCHGSHFIQCDPSATPPVTDLLISGNTFTANGEPFYRDSVGGQPVENGASGDVVSVRNVKRFWVTNNTIRGGGEIAITALHGSCDGVIANNSIDGNDALGIQIGGPDQKTVHNITVTGNVLNRIGLNKAGNAVNQCGIKITNADSIAVVDNLVQLPGRSCRYGLVADKVSGLTVANNVFEPPIKFRVPRVFEDSVTKLTTDIKPTR